MYFNNTNELSPLSNHPIREGKTVFTTVMHYYVYHKYRDMSVNSMKSGILLTRYNSNRFKPVPNWENIRFDIMYKGYKLKLKQHPELVAVLMKFNGLKWKPGIPIPFWDFTGDNNLCKLLKKLQLEYSVPVPVSAPEPVSVPVKQVYTGNIILDKLNIERYI